MEPAVRIAQESQSWLLTTASVMTTGVKTAAVHAPATGTGITVIQPGPPGQLRADAKVYPLPSSSSSSLFFGFVVLSSCSS